MNLIYTFDTIYNIKNKNITNKKDQKVIIIDNKNTYALLNKEINDEYFIDSTFKIMPKKYTNYKLMTITCINKKTNSTKICYFIAFKYQDVESYIRIFEYLKNNYNFSPKILHIDYENLLGLSLLNQFQKENKHLILF